MKCAQSGALVALGKVTQGAYTRKQTRIDSKQAVFLLLGTAAGLEASSTYILMPAIYAVEHTGRQLRIF